jgi:hypothetical protein
MTMRSTLGSIKRNVVSGVSRALGHNPNVKKCKLDAINFFWEEFKPTSFADLGGVWGVDAAYTFHALRRGGVTRACLVDTDFTPPVRRRQEKYPALELVNKNFGDPTVPHDLRSVDVVFLFDVLLHQVKPDWHDILAMYAPVTRGFIIYNQQWVSGDKTVRLLDLGEERYFQAIPPWEKGGPYDGLFSRLDEVHPQHQRRWRDVHNVWQWGIVDADLMAVMSRLGFTLQLYRNCGPFGRLKDFRNHLFIYTRTEAPRP